MLRTDTTRPIELPKMSRRSEERYKVAAPVSFKWRTQQGEWREGRGVTRDMSGRSLFILAYPVPVPDTSIVLAVEVPSLSTLKNPIVFHGQGRVVRVEPERGQPIGFAATVTFDDGEDAAAGND